MGQADLTLASGDRHARAFQRCGWTLADKRGRGKHFVLTKPGVRWSVSIPDHHEVKRSLLAKQIKGAGLTEAEYLACFK